MSRSTKVLAGGVAIVLGLGGVALARDAGYYGYGEPASKYQIEGWDIDVRPDGTGLPPGRGTVLEGEGLFEQNCSVCHGFFGEGSGRWPVLAGGFGTLDEEKPEKTVGSYWPYASTLWDYIHRAMPFFTPQSLSADQVYAITAYVLYLNDLVDEEFVADPESIAAIEMPNRDGFFTPDPRPDVHNVACMENCKDPESIQITWDASELGVTPTEHLQEQPEGEAEPAAEPGQLALAEDLNLGERVYNDACTVCHGPGIAGAPRVGDRSGWLDRIAKGKETLIKHAIEGFRGDAGYMPPKGGQAQLEDEEVAAAVSYMISESRAEDTQL